MAGLAAGIHGVLQVPEVCGFVVVALGQDPASIRAELDCLDAA